MSADELLELDIKNPYNGLDLENIKTIEKIKSGLLLLQNKSKMKRK